MALKAYVFTNIVTGETFTAEATETLDKLFAGKCANYVMGLTEMEAPKKTRVYHQDKTVLQMDLETGKILAEFPTQKAALEAIGKDPAKCSGISDAVNGRNKTGVAYGYKWAFKNPNA